MNLIKLIISIVLVFAFVLWSYVMYDSSRRYVHAELANQLIEMRIKEHALVSKSIEDLNQKDYEILRKRLQVLSEVYTEELHSLEHNMSEDSGLMESLVISRESMELLRQFVANNSISIEFTNGVESH